jgi:hypothetical protein
MLLRAIKPIGEKNKKPTVLGSAISECLAADADEEHPQL